MNYLSKIIKKMKKTKSFYTANDIVNEFIRTTANEPLVFDYIQTYILKLRQLNKTTTADNTTSMLHSFMKFRNKENFKFSLLTAYLIEQYEAYLKSRGISRNTTSFYMRSLRGVYNKAVEEEGIISKDIFKHVYTGIDKTIKRAISMKEIKKIKELDLSNDASLNLTKNLFLFSFYTRGMSFIDMAYLKKKNLINGTLTYRRRKTGQQLTIQWEKAMQQIIETHLNKTQYLLPIILQEDGTEWKQYKNALMLTNRKLKKIGKMAGISLPLSMYVSRHSWATIARDMNIPLSVISEGLGHDNDTNTQIYLTSIKTTKVDQANHKIITDLLNN